MKKKRCKNVMPEPLGTFPCRLPPAHKGPCSHKGLFTAYDGRRICFDIAWTSKRQMKEKERGRRESERLLKELR